MCLKIDLRKSEVTTAVNGNLLRTVVGKKIGNSPSLLYMVLGRSKNYQFVEKQFQGSVSNIQLYTNSTNLTITALSSEPCRVEGDLVAWHPGDWRVEGDRWLLVEETRDSVVEKQAREGRVRGFPPDSSISWGPGALPCSSTCHLF